MIWLMTFWHHLLAASVIAAGSTSAEEGERSISLSLSLEAQYEDEMSIASSHRVFVGASGGLRFRPQYVEAAVGDLITFEFLALNHSIKQSSFDNPCVYGGGFDTNFWQYNPCNDSRHTVDMLVTTTTPQWFYCQQTMPWPHCSAGMVFAVNPGAHWEEYLARAQHHASAGGAATNTLATDSAQPLSGSSLQVGTGTIKSMSFTYDPKHSSSICDTATSSGPDSSAVPPIVIVPLDTSSQKLERRTLAVGGSGSGYVHGNELSLWGTAVDSWLGKTQPIGPVVTAESGLGTALSTGAIFGTASSHAAGVCGTHTIAASTWQWPSQSVALPSVQSATALSSASSRMQKLGLASILTLQVFVVVYIVTLG